MRLIPTLEGDLTWRDVPALVIWIAVLLAGMLLFDMVRSLGVWRELANLPLWFQFIVRFGALFVAFGLYLAVIHGKWVRLGNVSLRSFLLGVVKVSSLVGFLGAVISFLPWWVFLLLFTMIFIVGHVCERLEHKGSEIPPLEP